MADNEATPEPKFVLDWEKLTAPVPEEDIEYVEKARGQKFAYMTAQFLRRRLDSVAQGRWSYGCEHVPFVQDQPLAGDGEPFVVKGRLTIDTSHGDDYQSVARESFGSGKNFKEAETDAFKRAAQRLGIGNELYEMDAVPAGGPVGARVPVSRPQSTAVGSATDVPVCKKCGGAVYDNRLTKTGNQPDFKCKTASCATPMWLPKAATKESIQQSMDDEKLPF